MLDDGYQDGAVTLLSGHTPWGPMRGGKYSALEAGTRLPFIVSWPAQVKSGVSDVLFSQMDILASVAHLLNQKIPHGDAPDSEDHLDALLGKSKQGRSTLIEQGSADPTAIIKGDWKYIKPHPGVTYMKEVGIESGNSPSPQLYNLRDDIGEKNNLANTYPDKVKELDQLLKNEVSKGTEKK